MGLPSKNCCLASADRKHENMFLYMYNHVHTYIYIYMLAPALPPPEDLRFRGSWGMRRTKHCNAQKNPKFRTSELTKCCNAPKIPKFWHLRPGFLKKLYFF